MGFARASGDALRNGVSAEASGKGDWLAKRCEGLPRQFKLKH